MTDLTLPLDNATFLDTDIQSRNGIISFAITMFVKSIFLMGILIIFHELGHCLTFMFLSGQEIWFEFVFPLGFTTITYADLSVLSPSVLTLTTAGGFFGTFWFVAFWKKLSPSSKAILIVVVGYSLIEIVPRLLDTSIIELLRLLFGT